VRARRDQGASAQRERLSKEVKFVTAFAAQNGPQDRFAASRPPLTVPDLTDAVEAGTTRTEFVTAASFPT